MSAAKETKGECELEVFDASGKAVGKRSVSAAIFDCDVVPSLMHEVVRWQRAKKRSGTHTVKTRAEVAGGGKKPWRQKGTGNARAGSNTSPVWVGGGVAHGPKQRNYTFSINKQQRRRALCSALTVRNREQAVSVLKDFELSEIKTKDAVQVLNALGVEKGKGAVVVVPSEDSVVTRSLRNVPKVKVLSPQGLNVYDVLNTRRLILMDEVVEGVEQRLA